jgi:2-haloacid dehalogenase|tara:strand:- start:1532 stop:2143 length:612 start_codon:yes stop_codon:yes gene_type:complete
MKIQTIIFDLGGVLIDWNPEYVYLKEFNGDRIKMKWFFENICTSSWNEQQDGGKLMKEATKERVKLFPEYKKLIEMFYGRWEEMLKDEISGTVKIIQDLKKNNYRLIALTNWSAETFPIAIKKYKFLELFEGIVVSGEIKMLKPFKEIYDYTIEKYNLDPKKCVFIDDRLDNVEGAVICGINGIQFESPEKLINKLKELKVEI